MLEFCFRKKINGKNTEDSKTGRVCVFKLCNIIWLCSSLIPTYNDSRPLYVKRAAAAAATMMNTQYVQIYMENLFPKSVEVWRQFSCLNFGRKCLPSKCFSEAVHSSTFERGTPQGVYEPPPGSAACWSDPAIKHSYWANKHSYWANKHSYWASKHSYWASI